MIVSDRHRLIFVHIPKCAGTSVQIALQRYDDAGGAYVQRVEHHPRFGLLDHGHMPLVVLRAAFPREFEKLRDYRSFAVSREPMARFRSALAQRLFQYGDRKLEHFGEDELRRETGRVIEQLTREPLPITRPDLIHFARQVDYVALDGVRLVGTIHDLASVDDMARGLSAVVGEPVVIGRENRSYTARNEPARHAIRRLTPISRRMRAMPGMAPLKRLVRSALTVPLAQQVPAALASDEVSSFVTEFYREDYRLRQSLGFAGEP